MIQNRMRPFHWGVPWFLGPTTCWVANPLLASLTQTNDKCYDHVIAASAQIRGRMREQRNKWTVRPTPQASGMVRTGPPARGVEMAGQSQCFGAQLSSFREPQFSVAVPGDSPRLPVRIPSVGGSRPSPAVAGSPKRTPVKSH